MKTILQKLCSGLIYCSIMLATVSTAAQIDYFEDFDNDNHRWTTLDFYTTGENTCTAGYAYRANPINEAGVRVPAETVSPALGISNGEVVTVRYNYKLLDYDDVLPYRPVDDADWGTISLEYGPTQNGPWTQIDYIAPYSHVVSDECANRTVSFTPELDTEVYLRFFVDAGTSLGANYYVYIDDISVYQETLSTGALVVLDDLQVYPNPVRDLLILEYPGYIIDVAVFDLQGQAVAVEDMDNDFKRLNMEGLAQGQYIVKIATDDTMVRTVNVIKM